MTHKKTDEGYPIFRSYLEEENDKPYYSMNTLSFYYEDMERKQKLIEDLAKAIAGYDQTLTGNLQVIEEQVTERFEQWDEKLKTFDGSVMDLLREWVDDGTMDHIVDSSIVDRKLEPIAAQLAETANEIGHLSNGNPFNSIWEEFEQRGINVTWFGAVADANYYDETTKKYYTDSSKSKSATDNNQPFQNAVDFLVSVGGGTLYAPRGNYAFRSGVKWKSKVSLVGAGIGNTKFFTEGTIFSLFHNLDGPANGSGTENDFLKDCRFENFEVDLIGLTHDLRDVGGKAFFILYMRRARFNNLYLKNTIGTALGCDFLVDTVISNVVVDKAGRNWVDGATGPGGGQSGIGIGSCAVENEPVIVTNCHVYNCGNYGIFVETQNNPSGVKSQNARVVNCYVDGNRLGIGNKGSGAILISNNSIINSKSHGVHLGQVTKGDMVFNNKIVGNGEDGVNITADHYGDVQIANNRIKNNKGSGIRVMRLGSYPKENVEILSNLIGLNDGNGIWLQGNSKNFKVSNNTIFNNGQGGLGSAQSSGIALEIEQKNGLFLGNLIYDDQTVKTQSTGIRFSTNVVADSLKFDSNHIVDYTRTTAINLNGTRTNIDINNNTGYATSAIEKSEFTEGVKAMYLTHNLGAIPKSVNITPIGNGRIWVSQNNESNRIRVERDVSIGALEFYWEVKV